MRVYTCPAGYPTIGVGRNIQGKGITTDEALMLLRNDIAECEADLAITFPFFSRLDEARKAALIDLRFNVGPGKFRLFKKMIAALAKADYETAAKELLDSAWATQVQPARVQRVVGQLRTGQL